MCSPFGRVARYYRRMLCRHPFLVQGVQTGLLMATGDVLAQAVVEKKCEWDRIRTAQFFTLGLVAVGPALTMWYKYLDRTVRSCGIRKALEKMALDQLLFAPAFLGFFLVAVNLLQWKCPDEIQRELECKYKDILITNYTVWPAVQLFNFAVVPLQYQVLLVQVVAVFWNTYLSWKSRQALEEADANDPKNKGKAKKVDPKNGKK